MSEKLAFEHLENSKQKLESVVVDVVLPMEEYRLYKGRFIGLVALVVLNIVAAMPWPWFGPIANNLASEFDFTLDQVNWLSNIVALVYLPTALLIPPVISRYGIHRCCQIGAVMVVLSAWIRYAGTARSLSPKGAYALLMVGQLFSSIGQPIYQVMGPKFSETWFNLNGRTTATMIIAISNPFGGALGQLISPLAGNTRQSILVLGIISTAVVPLVFLIQRAPPTPPTYAASKKPLSLLSLCRAMLGLEVEPAARMSRRERFDFTIIVLIFGVLVGSTNGFSILSAEILQPVGYSSDESGFMGACLLLAGMVAAIASAPLFDRVFTHRLALSAKILLPFVAVGWFCLIWAVRPHNTVALFIIMGVIGVCSLPMLAIGMELACEVTRNADGSSAIIWFSGNLFTVAFVLIAGALRAGSDGSPPLNLKRYLIFEGIVDLAICATVFLLKGTQVRKALDEEKTQQTRAQ
ncbi:major facilitator superfamily domain-containing protein [Gymnopilus junonius]|uniref:Major facilitator superfamily domain-containing protein n=1 Tax=Gymnopilus junonius TaxID=109634 RepID=A0A9P5NN50_GYMJU|nr:major facilitator superfamily domain-containing protein [Gymnopilus junonius]